MAYHKRPHLPMERLLPRAGGILTGSTRPSTVTAPGAQALWLPSESAVPRSSAGVGRPAAIPRLPRLRHSIAWSLAGNIAYAGSLWAILAITSKFGSPQMVGQFALALAITAPVFLLANLQLRATQATDVIDRYPFCEYLGVRLAAVACALVVILIIVAARPQSRTTTAVILLVTCAKSVESISDVIHGFLQKHERMDLIAVSLTSKGLTSAAAFGITLALTSNIVSATAALALAWGVVLAIYDLRIMRTLAQTTVTPAGASFQILPRWSSQHSLALVRMTLPLGLVSMLISLNANVPRYFIEHFWGERSLGFFAAIAYVTVAGTFVIGAVGQAALPRLARYYESRDTAAFKTLVIKLSAIAIALGVGGVLVALVAGQTLLSVLYRAEYGQYSSLLSLMMCAAALSYWASILNYAMIATRTFHPQLPLFVAVTGISVGACGALVPEYAMHGAALALIGSYTVHALGAVAIVTRAQRRQAVSQHF
jgi:O-antigen/teichoic acid export membrane protein